MKVITISGKAQNGKDTTAGLLKAALEADGYKVLITHYADLLKYICKQFFGWDGQKDDAGRHMIKRTIKETVREYDADGKVVRETVTETTEDDDTMYFPPFQTYQETVKPWWGEPSCTCKTNS